MCISPNLILFSCYPVQSSGIPTPPGGVQSVGQSSASVTWPEAMFDNGESVDSYRIDTSEIKEDRIATTMSEVASSSSRQHTVCGLEGDNEYQISVVAEGSCGSVKQVLEERVKTKQTDGG